MVENTDTQNEVNEHLSADPHKKHFWKREEEELLREWADKAQCYQWLHLQAHDKYRKKNTWFTIPVIVLSTITGTANFAQDRFGDDYKNAVVMGIGSLNIIAGIITTIYQFLKISEYNEAHRVASLSWGKFFRNIKTELSKNPLDRYAPYEMVKMSKEEFDRLVEISPLIPNDIANKFKKAFKKIEGVTRPDIVGSLEPTTIYEISEDERKRLEKIYLYGETRSTMSNYVPNGNANNNSNNNSNNNLLTHSRTVPINPEVSNRITKFRNTFFKLNSRYPNNEEIQRKLTMVYDDETEMDDIARILGNTNSFYPIESNRILKDNSYNNNTKNSNISNVDDMDNNYLEMVVVSNGDNDNMGVNNDVNNDTNNDTNNDANNINIVISSNDNSNDNNNDNNNDGNDNSSNVSVSEV